MSTDPAYGGQQLEMFSLEKEERKKKKREEIGLSTNILVSRRVLLYVILGLIVLMGIVYILGVEQGRRWKIDHIYKRYILPPGAEVK